MKRRTVYTLLAVVAIAAFAAGAGVGILGYVTVTGGSGEASEDASERAPQLSLDGLGGDGDEESNTETEDENDAEGSEGEPEAALPSSNTQLMRFTGRSYAAQSAPDVLPAQDDTDSTESDATDIGLNLSRGLYRINQEASEVRFILQEDLRGVRTDVIGTTDQIGGDVIVNFLTPAESQVGGIVINARTLETDNPFRNQAIRGQILRSAEDAYEFIEFTPTALENLPEDPVTVGDTITFDIIGDLTIVETTREVTFEASVVVSENNEQIDGTASTVVLWEDFNLSIPDVPGVANITPEVTLEIDFVAELVDGEELTEEQLAELETATSTNAEGSVEVPFDTGLFRINQEASEVRFILQEDLRGVRTDVIGITNQVGGDVIVSLADPAQSQVGTMVINARTLKTDNPFRNQAIRGQILRSAEDAYEFIEFVPTELVDLPADPIALDSEVAFQIVGELTIVETTREVTFEATATVTEDGEALIGTADTVVLWEDFNLSIPDVPGVANITPEVTLEIDFVAELVDSQ